MSSSSTSDLLSKRQSLIESWQYIACPEFSSYAHWVPINATSNELCDPDGKPATIVIVGQIVSEKLAVDPLGNYQSQGERQQRYQDSESRSDSISCPNAKQIIVLRRPSASLWMADYDSATSRLHSLQEKVARTDAPRQHLLDKDQDPPFVRVSFPLWEKKRYQTREKFLNDVVEEEDEVIRSVREEHDFRTKQTVLHGSYLPDNLVDAFRNTSKTHHIRLLPVFLQNGKQVPTNELFIRLDNAVVEIMFSLKHYYYGPAYGKFKQSKVGNTYTASIEQVTIIEVNTVVPSPLRQPTMKTVQSTPPSKKRASSGSPVESTPSKPKKNKNKASSSSSTLSPAEDDVVEEREVQSSLPC